MAEMALELIEAAYAAAGDPELWSVFGEVCERRLSSSVAVYAHPTDEPWRNRTLLHRGLDAKYAALNREELHSRNVLILNAARHTAPVLLAEEVVDREVLEGSEFFNEYMRPQRLHHAVNLNLVTGGRHRVSLALMRDGRFGSYDGLESQLLNRLVPHLRQAFDMAERLDLLHAQSRTSFAVFERLSAAVMTVDDRGKLVFSNRAALRLMARGGALADRGGRLMAARPEADGRLKAAVERATRARPAATSLSLPRGGGLTPLSVSVVPSDPRRSIFAAMRPLAIILVHDPAEQQAISEEGLRARFDATPTEARLAVALCAGESLASYAGTAGVSITTAKTHLNGLFAKLGTNRQADLVRTIVTDPALRALS
jgi:DNA-binding CsgD family transcriptional regulator